MSPTGKNDKAGPIFMFFSHPLYLRVASSQTYEFTISINERSAHFYFKGGKKIKAEIHK